MTENKSKIILNTANSPIKFQNDITNVCLHSHFFDFSSYPNDKPVHTQNNRHIDGAYTNDNKGYQYDPKNYTNHSYTLIICYLTLAPSLRACTIQPKKQKIKMTNDICCMYLYFADESQYDFHQQN